MATNTLKKGQRLVDYYGPTCPYCRWYQGSLNEAGPKLIVCPKCKNTFRASREERVVYVTTRIEE